jgi:hypothetical protein
MTGLAVRIYPCCPFTNPFASLVADSFVDPKYGVDIVLAIVSTATASFRAIASHGAILTPISDLVLRPETKP